MSDEMVEASAYIAALYAHPAGDTGGPLHIVVDDNNVQNDNLGFCRDGLEQWEPSDEGADRERVIALSRWILDLLEPMTVPERAATVALAHGDLIHRKGEIYRVIFKPESIVPNFDRP